MRYWAQQAIELCADIDDSSLEEPVQPLLEALDGLRDPRRIMVIGATGVGKSSILSHLANCSVIAKVPQEGLFMRWRYRNDTQEAVSSRFIPVENLDGLELVDTASCAEQSTRDVLLPIAVSSDVVIAVMDARASEQSPAWEILTELPEERLANCMIVLTYTDTMPASAAVELNATLRQLCRERLLKVLPIFQVCPTSSQGVDVFVDRVQEMLDGANGVRAVIRRVLDAAVNLMYKQGSVLKTRGDIARTDSGFLAGIEQEIDNFLAHQMQGVTECASRYADAVCRTRGMLRSRLRKNFGWLLSPVTLLRLELMGPTAEDFYYRSIKNDIINQQLDADSRFIHSCSLHWKHVRPRMKQALDCEIGDFPEEELSAELAQLRSGLEHDLYEPFRRQQIRSDFGKFFKEQIGWMRSFIIMVCFLLCVAGLLGFVGQDMLAVCTLLLTALVWILGTLTHLVISRHLPALVQHAEKIIAKGLNSIIQHLVQGLVVSRVSAYRRLYTSPRRKVAEREASLQPLMERHSDVYRQLRAAAPRI